MQTLLLLVYSGFISVQQNAINISKQIVKNLLPPNICDWAKFQNNYFFAKKIIALFFLCFITTKILPQSFLQPGSFSIKKITQNDGLSQGSNYFAFEDSKGFMWLTANDAMNRYDGNWVKVYKDERYFTACSPLKQGYCFAEDSKSNIYIGSTIGLYKYNRLQDNFTLINIFKNEPDSNCVPFAFRENKVWCYNRYYHIAAYDVTSGKINFYNDIKFDSIESLHPYMFGKTLFLGRQPFFDKEGKIWLADKFTLASYDIKNHKTQYFLGNEQGEKPFDIHSICYDSAKNRILIGTIKGLLVFDLANNKTTIYRKIENMTLDVVDYIRMMGDAYVFTNVPNSITVISNDFKATQVLNENTDINLASYTNFPIWVDKNQKLWLCNSGFGLTVVYSGKQTLSKAEGYAKYPHYFSKTGTQSFAEFSNGNILISSAGSNFLMNSKTNLISNFSEPEKHSIVTYALPLCSDYIRKGIWSYENNKLRLVDENENELFSMDCNSKKYGMVQDIEELPDGDIWVAFSTGVYRIDFTDKKLVPINNLQQPNPFKLSLLSNHRAAISYLNGDMKLIEYNSLHEIKVITTILPGIKTFYFQQDTLKNVFWAGADDGLYLLDKNFHLLKKFNAANGLGGSYIYGLLLDNENNVWASHEKGLSSINGSSYQMVNYDEDDNIQDNDYNNRCFFKAKDGTLYFGGIKGFNWFKPPVIIPSFYQPELYIDEIKINNQPYLTDTNYNNIDKLQLSSDQNKISIHAVIKDLDMVHSNEIIYRFKNLDTAWQYLPANSYINFNNLAAGTYELELGYYNRKQQLPVLQKTLEINIPNPFYMSILFWILVSIVLTSLVFIWFSRERINAHKRLYQQELSLTNERSRITTDLHDDVGASLSSLQINTAVAKKLMDTDIEQSKKYLDKVIEQSSDISSNIGDIIWSMKPENERFADLDSRIRNTVSNMLGATDINYSIDLETQLEPIIKSITARKNILLIIKEATNNCAKYSKAANYRLIASIVENQFLLTITDDGIGICSDKMNTGNGFHNMRKRTEELHGKLIIETSENKGTWLFFTFPPTTFRD